MVAPRRGRGPMEDCSYNRSAKTLLSKFSTAIKSADSVPDVSFWVKITTFNSDLKYKALAIL